MTKSILITGGRGMLAWDLSLVLRSALPEVAVKTLDREGLDITSSRSIEEALEKYRPQWVVNTAAYTQVDLAETEREAAELVNAKAPGLLAQACAAAGAKLVHFSTDQVFDGKVDHPRTEEDTPSPINHYGATKLRGEEAALKNSDALVLRVQWLYGKRKDRFTPLKEKKVFTPFADQVGAPTWTREIAQHLVTLLEEDARGLFHFSYDDFASWADVFQFVKETWGLDLALEPKITSTLKLPAERPLFSVLSNAKLKTFLGIREMGSWREPLREFLLS